MNTPEDCILVVDDEPKYLSYIKAVLEASGHAVFTAADGQAAVEVAARQPLALILLDVRMPRLDGHAACQRIREFSTVPIIMLTALAQNADVVRGLEAGADDYIAKPFSTEVLLARVNAVLRRATYSPAPKAAPVFETGELRIDYARHKVWSSGQEVPLTPTEYALLCTLARAAGRVMAHTMILEEVWGADYAGQEDMVRRVVHRLRQKIEPDPATPRYIQTEPGVGYVLNSPV